MKITIVTLKNEEVSKEVDIPYFYKLKDKETTNTICSEIGKITQDTCVKVMVTRQKNKSNTFTNSIMLFVSEVKNNKLQVLPDIMNNGCSSEEFYKQYNTSFETI